MRDWFGRFDEGIQTMHHYICWKKHVDGIRFITIAELNHALNYFMDRGVGLMRVGRNLEKY